MNHLVVVAPAGPGRFVAFRGSTALATAATGATAIILAAVALVAAGHDPQDLMTARYRETGSVALKVRLAVAARAAAGLDLVGEAVA